MTVDPEEFAAQVNYLAALGRMIVPRAFSFAGGRILFVGHEPFDAWELGSLLPEEVEWYEQEDAPSGFAPGLVVLGRGGYTKDSLRSVLGGLRGAPKVVPQEGFLDELLFGHDWWGEEVESLRRMTDQHRGLQIAKSVGVLVPVGMGAKSGAKARIVRPAPIDRPPARDVPWTPKEAPTTPGFSWPSTEAEETRGSNDGEEFDLRARSRLNELGYNTKERRPVRWLVLTERAVPELGLPKVAGMIAWFCRSRKQQRDGRRKFVRAIGEWEHDLDRLEREVYPGHRPKFEWPRSEPR